ncbi:SDR family oxidoreductase [Bdellovibrionota bacterium FG-2]
MKILITGGSSDISLAFTKRRLKMGDQVILTSSTEKSLRETLERYQAQGLAVTGLVFDLNNPKASHADFAELLKQGLDAVVLNAASRVVKLRRFHEISEANFDEYISENVFGNTWLIRQVLPSMMEKKWGRLVFVSSVACVTGMSKYGAYCLSKAALEALFLNLAVDYGEFGIFSNIVRPGIIKTARTRRFWKNEEYVTRASSIIPANMLGEPDQVAEAFDPLLSVTSYMNGSVVTVSGGLPLFRAHGASEP